MKSSGRLGPGAFTILMILVVLMMTMLGVLSLVSARNDRNMTLRIQDASQAYYGAQAEFAEWLAELDGELAALREQAAGSDDDYARLVREALDTQVGEALEFTALSGDFQQLCAQVQIQPLEETERYLILDKRLVPLGSDWLEEDAGWTLIM